MKTDLKVRCFKVRCIIAACAVILFAPLLTSAADAPDPAEYRADLNKGVWVHGPNLPSPRQDASAVVLAGRVYVIGGFGPNNQQMNSVLVWEPEVVPGNPKDEAQRAGSRLGSWTSAAPIPEPVDHAAAAAAGSYIYVAGGRIENLVTNKFWRYDAAADSWVELPSMPIPRYGATMEAIGPKLYLIGGAASHGNDEKSIEVFDIATERWSVNEHGLAAGKLGARSAVIDDRIAIVGGSDDEERLLSSCDLYDPARDRWRACSSLHQARSDFGLSMVAGRLIAVGGEDLRNSRTTQTTEISEQFIRGWLSGPWLPGPRHGMAQVTVGDVVWIIGGSPWSGTGPSTLVLRYVSPVVKVKFKGHA